MRNSQGFGIEIIVDGRPLREYTKDGKTYVAAPWNRDYSIRFIVPRQYGNRYHYKRFLGVTSVDGLDIMTGKLATPHSSGYVLTPAESLTENDIPGFRLNNDEVARFRFGDRADSYAAMMDKPANIGAIGVIYFSEYDPAPRRRRGDFTLESTGGSRGGMSPASAGHDMGTEFGRRTEHRVSTTHFDKDTEVARFTIEYASYEKLKDAGIITDSPLGEVDPFGDRGGSGCTPPRNWRG